MNGQPSLVEKIYNAIFKRDLQAIKELIENRPNSIVKFNNIVVPLSSLDIAKFLLTQRINIIQNDILFKAVEVNSLPLVKFLVENKADVTAQNNQAIKKANVREPSVLKFLVENKADVTVENNRVLIQTTGWYKDLDFLKFLVENKADILAQNNKALVGACYSGNLDIVKFLVENKADINTPNDLPIEIAARRRKITCVEYLIAEGADIGKVPEHIKYILLKRKYYKKWRKIVFKSLIRKVLIPLYYSPGFPGWEKGRREIIDIIL